MVGDEINVVKAFIAAINRRSSSELSGLMTEDHTFVDSCENTSIGRGKVTEGWDEFFRIFPDFEIKIDCILQDKAVVAVFGSTSGTYNGKRGLVPETELDACRLEGRAKERQNQALAGVCGLDQRLKVIAEDGLEK